MAKQNILLIINPTAGRKKSNSMLYGIVDFLCRNDFNTTVYITSKRGEAKEIVREQCNSV